MIKISFALDLTGVEGVEGKEPKDVFIDWISSALDLNSRGDPIQLMISDGIIQRAKATTEDGVTISHLEFLYCQLCLVRASFEAKSRFIYCQLLKKFQINLPDHNTPEMVKVES